MTWQPIDEPPEERQKVLLWSPPSPRGLVGEMDVGYINMKFVGNLEYKYTHWMPLPAPPTKEQGTE